MVLLYVSSTVYDRGLGIGKTRIRRNVVAATFIVAPETKNAVEVKLTPRFCAAKRSRPVVVVSFFVAARQPLLRFPGWRGFLCCTLF